VVDIEEEEEQEQWQSKEHYIPPLAYEFQSLAMNGQWISFPLNIEY
jgi:hypothetical protein